MVDDSCYYSHVEKRSYDFRVGSGQGSDLLRKVAEFFWFYIRLPTDEGKFRSDGNIGKVRADRDVRSSRVCLHAPVRCSAMIG